MLLFAFLGGGKEDPDDDDVTAGMTMIIDSVKHQTLTQTQTVITHEFSQLNIAKPHLH